MQNQTPNFKNMGKRTNKLHIFCWLICFVICWVSFTNSTLGIIGYGINLDSIIPSDEIDESKYWTGNEISEQEIKSMNITTQSHSKIVITTAIVLSENQFAYFFVKCLSGFEIRNSISYIFNITLKNDINLGQKFWGTVRVPARCTLNFDGKLHHIYGLRLDGNISKGIIMSADSGNLVFNNLRVHVSCSQKGRPSSIDISKGTNIGTFVGNKTSGSVVINNCYTYGNIDVSYDDNKTKYICSGSVGGYVGSCYNLTIKNCINTITISALRISCVGGFVGNAQNSCRLELCSNLGKISGSSAYVGGLVGYSTGLDLEDSRSCNLADITTNLNNTITESGYAGGLVGYIKSIDGEISYCFNNNKIKSTYGVAGGLVGDSKESVSFSNVYNSGDVITTKNIEYVEKTFPIEFGFYETNSFTFFVDNQWHNITSNANPVEKVNSYYRLVADSYTVTYKLQRDVSFIGNDNKLILGTYSYSIKPSYIDFADYKYSVNIDLKKLNAYQDYDGSYYYSRYDEGNTVYTTTIESDWLSTYKNKASECLVYSYRKVESSEYFSNMFYEDGDGYYHDYNYAEYGYSKVCYIDNYFRDAIYYNNRQFFEVSNSYNKKPSGMDFAATPPDHSKLISSSKEDNNLCGYVYETDIDILYSIYKKSAYNIYGGTKNVPVSKFESFLEELKWINRLWIEGARMYIGFDENEQIQDIIICPLLRPAVYHNNRVYQYPLDDNYQYDGSDSPVSGGLDIPFLLPMGEPGGASSGGQIKAYNVERIDMEGNYNTIAQIKSARFSGNYYGRKDGINNGMPTFKEMYWELA